jgi:hypothetical protein
MEESKKREVIISYKPKLRKWNKSEKYLRNKQELSKWCFILLALKGKNPTVGCVF